MTLNTTRDSPADETWKSRLDAVIAALIKSQQFATYADLADLVSVPPPHRIHKLTIYLEELIALDIARNAPLRAALAISKTGTNIPARGFFDCCARHGLTPETGESDADFHARLVSALLSRSFPDHETENA